MFQYILYPCLKKGCLQEPEPSTLSCVLASTYCTLSINSNFSTFWFFSFQLIPLIFLRCLLSSCLAIYHSVRFCIF